MTETHVELERSDFMDRRVRSTRDSQEASIRIGMDIALSVLCRVACAHRGDDAMPFICSDEVKDYYDIARKAINREWSASFSLEYGIPPRDV